MTKREAEAPGPPRADWAEIRRDYEDLSVPLSETAAKAGLPWQTLARIAAGAGWKMRKAPPKPDAPAAELVGAALQPTKLAARLKRLIAREIEAIEGESTQARDPAEKERDARRLSSLVRSLEKLNDIKASKSKRPKETDGKEEDGDVLKAELHRRLARLRAAGSESAISREPQSS